MQCIGRLNPSSCNAYTGNKLLTLVPSWAFWTAAFKALASCFVITRTKICRERWINLDILQTLQYSVSQKKSPPPRGPDIFHFFHKRLRICNRFFTHLLNVPIFARWQIFIQLSQILTKLCHIKRDYPVHIICAKCPKRTKTRAFRRLRKSLIALLIVVCGKSL